MTRGKLLKLIVELGASLERRSCITVIPHHRTRGVTGVLITFYFLICWIYFLRNI